MTYMLIAYYFATSDMMTMTDHCVNVCG